jgi:phosphoglycolate phosphatase-like HAD superfamily hydrolase
MFSGHGLTVAPDQIGSGRAWDTYDAYLFDIDGTLLNCTDAVHYFAFCDALTELAGKAINLNGVVTHGNTDVGILRDALRLHGVEEARWRPRLAEARKRMCGFVQHRELELRIRVLPAVREILRHLAERGAVLGLATGNLEMIGWMKLRACELARYFQFGGFSDAFESRVDVFRAALAEAQRRTSPGAAVCVVGDTPADIRAAREIGLDVIAVATGIYTPDQLLAESPNLCLGTLAELLGESPAKRLKRL